MARKYRARRYKGAPQKQETRFQGQLIGCTETAFATGVDDVTFGAVIVNERICRKLSGEVPPDPSSPGLNQDQLVGIATQLHIDYSNHTGLNREYVRQVLGNNQRVVAQLWYSGVGGGNIGHAWLLERRRYRKGRWQLQCVDPVPGTRFYYDEDKVFAAMHTFAEKTGLTNGLRWGAFDHPLRFFALGARKAKGMD
jgi:hypothetical protein